MQKKYCLTISATKETIDKFKELAEKDCRTLSGYINKILTEHLKKIEKEKGGK